MRLLYDIGVRGYHLLIRLASLRSEKARKWIKGRRNIFSRLKEELPSDQPIYWFHVASLGEFEQGRPVIEAIRKKVPDVKILLTFFSPSGYEVRKDYEFADYVYYLPLDTPYNVKRFLDIVKPEKAFFVKYEFWFHYLTALKKRGIPTYIFSAIFRPGQIFFKPWGSWYRKALQAYTHIFVQNQESLDLLNKFGFTNVSLSGDTRFDRVGQIADAAPRLSVLDEFANGKKLVIAGSTWKADEALLLEYINSTEHDVKYVIAPHEVSDKSIQRITTALDKKYVRFSKAGNGDLKQTDVLIVDGYGYLTSVYRYGNLAYIGGGFGSGIHNILEAATFGMPVIFGPNHEKFQEALDLLEKKAAFCIHDFKEFKSVMDEFLGNEKKLQLTADLASNYVSQSRGASDVVVDYIFN
ncbi:3-deoxy-D-manno-octulosonic acid transferase [Prolixibacter denitrificans]|uniref:3-deoxy-D-manno-octulosonic acid transferase n=1 Tax=Prolixibacter denitrificans TaxID=1541063 RepID=A0A2P8CI13_9BACT|nr:glycosyltransferase N-terminal domain-containing protein [Prolixibacter denitrificans]PSK84615.1 3-deoxy-D-manno-octulosonic-acid transferase [Prolixibacter denitrificans]GET20781.1 3-deoxy-D-manno-octulosonic acid transferase [Prolixibacter denitrificans]